ncbi:MAG: hypothetical protein EXQ93_07545 [Alphaproteobacteria bacterium]|nr:hypothetical protein [Alphaproteobacteria bacterium]
MAARRQRRRRHPAVPYRFVSDRGVHRTRQGPSIVRLNDAGIQRRGGAGERGLLFFGEGCVTAGGRHPKAPLFQRH